MKKDSSRRISATYAISEYAKSGDLWILLNYIGDQLERDARHMKSEVRKELADRIMALSSEMTNLHI